MKQSKVSDTRQLEDSSSFHMTFQYKHYSAAMIKDNLTVNKKRTHDTTDRIMSEKSSEFSTNTKLIPSSQIIPKNFPKRQKLENVYQVKKI